MKFRYEATGSDIIPNKGLWIQLPLLIKARREREGEEKRRERKMYIDNIP